MSTVSYDFPLKAARKRVRNRKGKKRFEGQGSLPRITRLMALAIRFDQLIRDGVVEDYADLARLGGVTRARITQIMSLLNLAPDIQEKLLFLPPVTEGRDPITTREVLRVSQVVDWEGQRLPYIVRPALRSFGGSQKLTPRSCRPSFPGEYNTGKRKSATFLANHCH